MTESRPSFRAALGVWLKIGLLSFGGPAGQIATMHRMVVEEKRWVGESRFLHALNFCMLLPGPEAQQLATYLGWILHRIPGGLVAGILFVLPGAMVMMGLASLYVGFHQVPVVAGLFYGLKPAVLAVVVEASLRLGRRSLKAWPLRAVAAASFLAIFFLELPFPLIVLAAGLTGWMAARSGHPAFLPPEDRSGGIDDDLLAANRGRRTSPVMVALCCLVAWLAPVALAVLWGKGAFAAIGVFFAKMAVVGFGGAYALLGYVAQQAVEIHGWLSPGEMLDGLGLAETTPGPLILVNQFVGFIAGFRNAGGLDPWLGGVLGATLTVWVSFAPSFLWVFVGAPHIERLRRHAGLSGALAAIAAAVVGIILNLAVWFALHVVFERVAEPHFGPFRLIQPDPASLDIPAALLAAASLIAMLRLKWGMMPTLLAAATTGLARRLVLG